MKMLMNMMDDSKHIWEKLAKTDESLPESSPSTVSKRISRKHPEHTRYLQICLDRIARACERFGHNPARVLDRIHSLYASNTELLLLCVFVRGDEVVGHVFGEVIEQNGMHHCWITHLEIDVRMTQADIDRELRVLDDWYRAVKTQFPQLQVKDICMTTARDMKAWFRRWGFRPHEYIYRREVTPNG